MSFESVQPGENRTVFDMDNDSSALENYGVFSKTASLDTLPTELIWHTASFLDSKFICDSMSEVCYNFNCLFNDTKFWKNRMKYRWPKPYPAVPCMCFILPFMLNNVWNVLFYFSGEENNINWRQACVEREEQTKLWCDPTNNANYFKFTAGLYAPVDTVHFVGVTGKACFVLF